MSLDELYTSPQIAKRLGVSRQRVDQLVDNGQLPQPLGRSGNTRLWRASDIELALAGTDPASGRQATPAWDRVPAPDAPLRLDVDEVLTVPDVWFADAPRVHVRIWRGQVAGAARTVVLYGALTESHGIIVNYAETVARSIAAKHLSVGEARTAWYFGFWPRGFPRPDLQIQYVSFAFPRAAGGDFSTPSCGAAAGTPGTANSRTPSGRPSSPPSSPASWAQSPISTSLPARTPWTSSRRLPPGGARPWSTSTPVAWRPG